MKQLKVAVSLNHNVMTSVDSTSLSKAATVCQWTNFINIYGDNG